MSGKLLDRAVRESHTLMIFINNYKLGKVDELTAPQVAREMMLEPSLFVRKLLASLVAKGQLTMRGENDNRTKNLRTITDGVVIPSEGVKYWYKLSDKAISEIEGSGRDVNIKIGGVVVEQFRLF